MQLQITCPYCGKIMEITSSSAQNQDVICELCGSPINDEVKIAITNYQPPVKAENLGQAQVQKTPFPKSDLISPTNQATNVPSFTSQGSQSMRPPINGALLVFPQIQKQVQIQSNQNDFYFGRNSILPLVSPQDYDTEWLNSISRVRKDNYNRIIHQHFRIQKDSTGNYSIEDSLSRWGTWVNRQQIKGRGAIPLANGDKIELMLSKPDTKQIVPFEIMFYC
ncbi:MAG: FHA domain-containing protein [Promethearchaeota archaeon]|nr:MAG: FHA domain-containing protein [Candidatus Lokiarchaeota archaeon]